MSDDKKTDLSSFATLFDALPNETKEKIWADFETWRESIKLEFKIKFDVKETKRDMERDQVILYYREAFTFWGRKRPAIPKKGGIEVLDLLRTKECLGQIDRLKKQFNALDIEMSELKLDEQL